MKRILFVLMAVVAIAIVGCDKKNHAPDFDPEAPENLIPPKDTDGANQNRWGLAPKRILMPVTNTENGEE